MSGLKSELLKYKRTFMGKLIIFIPVFFAVYALVTQTSLMKDPMSESSSWKWESLLALIFNWWPFVFLPLGYALFAALAAARKKNPEITVLCVPAISILWHSGSIRSQLWLSLACFPLLSSWLRLSRPPAYKCGSLPSGRFLQPAWSVGSLPSH